VSVVLAEVPATIRSLV